MIKSILFILICNVSVLIPLHSQINESPTEVIFRFFHAMSDIDTAYIAEIIDDKARLSSSFIAKGQPRISSGDKQGFINSIATALPGELDEQISNLKVNIDGGLANVWMDYTFYHKGILSHCGVNNFTLTQSPQGWKILSIVDSRRKDNCSYEDASANINQMLDDWHLAASKADSTRYFDLMTVNSIYVGTDKTEVWPKRKFLEFAAPYFENGKAWDFKKKERNVYSDDFKQIAWFDEMLDTWMGPCRGSGVVIKDQNGDWKVQHYVLSVTVDNGDIQEFIKMGK